MPLFARSIVLAGVVAAAGIGFLLAAAPARAQYPVTLDEALQRLAYDPVNRGPLLILDPKGTPRPSQVGILQPLGEDRQTINIQEVAPYFGLKLFRIGAVSLLAPETMGVLNPPPGTPQEYARIGRGRAAGLFAASLTPAQWQQITGPQGLGASDLSDEQRDLFFALLPQEMKLQQMQMIGPEGSEESAGQARTLTPAQRAQVRLRVARELGWMFAGAGSGSPSRLGFGRRTSSDRKEGDTFYRLDSPQEYTETQDVLKNAVLGKVPNRLKRGDLPLDSPALKKPVALSGVETLGDLMVRIAEASGIEIYADRSIGGLPLKVITTADGKQTAPAGDVLKALCIAVCGAVRRVADPQTGDAAYLLTDDVEGLAPRRLRLHEWFRDYQSLSAAEGRQINETIRKQNIADQIRFAPNDPYAVSDAVMQRAEADLMRPRQPGEMMDTPIPVSDLPPAAQAEVKRQLKEDASAFNTGGGANRLITDKVFASFSLKTRLIVPGYGEFDGPGLMSLSEVLPRPASATPKPAPPRVDSNIAPRFAALRMALPRTHEETERLLRGAAAAGLKQIWVDVPVVATSREQKALADTCTVGKRLGLKVVALVRLLRVPQAARGSARGELARDLNIYGETLAQYVAYRQQQSGATGYQIDRLKEGQGWEWVRASDASTRKALHAGLKALMATPDLTGLVICDAIPPGYNRKGETYWSQTFPGVEMGYSPALRLACLRQENFDPIDLLPSGGTQPYWVREGGNGLFDPELRIPSISLPIRYVRDAKTHTWTRLEDGKSRTLAWNVLRYEEHRRVLKTLLGDLRTDAATLPLLFWGQTTEDGGIRSIWYAPWSLQASDALPDEQKIVESGNWLLIMPLVERSTAEAVRQSFANWAARAQRSPGSGNGLVLDAFMISGERLRTILAGLAASPRR